MAVLARLSHSHRLRPSARRSVSPSWTGAAIRSRPGPPYQTWYVWVPLSSQDGDSGELRPGPPAPSAPGRLGRPRAALVCIVPMRVCGPVLGAAIWAISCCGVRCGSDGVVDAALAKTVPAATTATAATAPVGTAHRVLRVSQGGWNIAHLFAAGRGAGKSPRFGVSSLLRPADGPDRGRNRARKE